MLAKKILTNSFLLINFCVFAQNFTLTGKVTNSQNQPLEYATISIQSPDSFEEIAGTVSDAQGNFSVETAAGNYILYIESFTGNTFEKPIEVSKNEDLGSFKLDENAVVSLEGATITGTNPIYKMELDKKYMIYPKTKWQKEVHFQMLCKMFLLSKWMVKEM